MIHIKGVIDTTDKKDDGKAELEQAVREYKELQAVSVDKREFFV